MSDAAWESMPAIIAAVGSTATAVVAAVVMIRQSKDSARRDAAERETSLKLDTVTHQTNGMHAQIVSLAEVAGEKRGAEVAQAKFDAAAAAEAKGRAAAVGIAPVPPTEYRKP